jgi:hypothetical protein
MFSLSTPTQSFSMRVVAYEFPDEELGPTEDNPAEYFETGRFLVIDVEFSRDGMTGRDSLPEMTTTELERMVDWLQTIADGNCNRTGVYFTERDLAFSVSKDLSVLRVHIFWYLLPDWATGTDLTLEFPADRAALEENIRSLHDDLTRFPGRPRLDGSA